MNYRALLVNVFECGTFCLPIIPDSFNVRITIMSIYFIGNYYKVQKYYSKLKYDFIHSKK